MLANEASRERQEESSSLARDRAAVYRLLSWLLLESPDEHFIREMLDSGIELWLNSGDAAAAPIAGGLAEIRDFLASRGDEDPSKLCLELAVQWTRLFRGIAPGYGPLPPYEALHRGREGAAQAELLLDLGQLYSAAGTALPQDRPERLDYLGLELELMGLLCSEESEFWLEGNAEDAGGRHDLQLRLLREHLLTWAPAHCELILRETDSPFYRGVASALSGLLKSEAALFSVAL
jgi:putative dimethyl sulfoxide reductase chaperone